MGIREHPALGTILRCSYGEGFVPPEMVKPRPVVVISPKIAARVGLCTVVPLSTTAPDPVMQYHCQIDLPEGLPSWMERHGIWVKGDMVSVVSFRRLDLIQTGKDRQGRRQYAYEPLSSENIKRVRASVMAGMGLAQLTKHL